MTEFEKNIISSHLQLRVGASAYQRLDSLAGGNPDGICIYGMGGSGLAGRIIRDTRAALGIPVPVEVWPDYTIPAYPFKNPLHLFVSFSGETAETLSAFRAAPPTAHRGVVTTGGTLHRLAETAGIATAVFSADTLQPRQATGCSFYALLGILQAVFPHILIPSPDQKFTGETYRAAGQTLAAKLAKKIIIVYTTTQHSHLAYNWKDRMNETGKALAFWNVVPEMCHNEIASFSSKPQSVVCLFLNDPDEHPENKKRIEILNDVLQQRGIETVQHTLVGNNLFEKIFNSLNLADWTAFSLAAHHGADPVDIAIIDEVKQRMK